MKIGTHSMQTVVHLESDEVALATGGKMQGPATLEISIDVRKFLTYRRIGKALRQKAGTKLAAGAVVLKCTAGCAPLRAESAPTVPTVAECEAMPYTPAPPTEEQAEAMIQAARSGCCATLRRKLVSTSTLGAPNKVNAREWQIEPCNVPLFGQGKECRGCRDGWEHPHNHRADRPAPKAEVTLGPDAPKG